MSRRKAKVSKNDIKADRKRINLCFSIREFDDLALAAEFEKMSVSNYCYVLPNEDNLLINRILSRFDRAIDIFEKIGNIEAQRFEMEIRESMQRVISRGDQQNIMKQLLPLIGNI